MNILNPESYSEIENLCSKYEELVWYARKPRIEDVDEHYSHITEDMRDIVKQCIRQTEEKYPKEINELHSCSSNWEHGFNSGCLASFRLILNAFDDGIEDALEDFPNLDT